jgi:molybdopterin-containing oxidoreductase family iron-sulfur binding subunit
MVIDTKKCLQNQQNGGCDACSSACHQIHNVPTIPEPKRHEIKWIWREIYEHAFPNSNHSFTHDGLKGKPVTVLCNHCERPPCVRVCPTKATWKRETDGIVMMDMHRCIGCRYCMAGCPYGARSFNYVDPRPHLEKQGLLRDEFPSRTKGVVEKCNFCAERIAQGQFPACVEACQVKNGANAALAFGNLYDPESSVAKLLRESHSIRRKPTLGTEPHVFYLV